MVVWMAADPVAASWTLGRVIGIGCPLLFVAVTAVLLIASAGRRGRG
ncbi:hypothetical protein [Luedemannella helvata]